MSLTDTLAAMRHWLRQSGSLNSDGYRIVIEVPTVDEEARIRLALTNEFEMHAIDRLDLDKPLRIMGFEVEFKWPK